MTLNVLTIVFNGMPFLPRIYEALKQYRREWRWVVVEGPSNNGGSTRWCKPQNPGGSTDGTDDFLKSLEDDPNVEVMSAPLWPSKDRMVGAGTSAFTNPGVLLQCDSDELWSADQLRDIVRLFEINQKATRCFFKCHYWVGPDIRIISATDPQNRWLRAWRFKPGMRWVSHEPPNLNGNRGHAISEHDTERLGLVFEHHSLSTEAQARAKQNFYGRGYEKAVEGWKSLQANTEWPTPLHKWLPWCPKGVMVEKIKPGLATQSEPGHGVAGPAKTMR